MLSNFRMSIILLIGVLTSTIFLFPESGDIGDTPLAKSLKKIELHVQNMQTAKKSPMRIWRELQASVLEEFSYLNIAELSEEEVSYMFKKLKNLALPIIKSLMTHGAKNLNNFSSYERYLLTELVESSLQMVKKGSIAYRFMKHLKKKLVSTQLSAVEYLKGEALEEVPSNQIKFFSWNTCMFPGNLSHINAGLAPWKERFYGILQNIEQQNADIVCLQQVYSEAAAEKLYESLKDKYAHFYVNMGPSVMGSKLSEIRLNAGLFVASKVALSQSCFEVFLSNKDNIQRNQGFFAAQIGSTELCFVTSHLAPFEGLVAQNAREAQLKKIIEYMKENGAKIKILTGDLNIPFGSNEPAEHLMNAYFYDPYNKNRASISKHSRTFSDHFLTKAKEGKNLIVDYFLIMQQPGFEKYAYVIERVEGFDEVSLHTKGSDHHGLFSQIVFPYSY